MQKLNVQIWASKNVQKCPRTSNIFKKRLKSYKNPSKIIEQTHKIQGIKNAENVQDFSAIDAQRQFATAVAAPAPAADAARQPPLRPTPPVAAAVAAEAADR